MKLLSCILGIFCLSALCADENFAFPHDEIKQYSMHGNFQKGLATKGMGSHEFEIWRASIAGGSKTPRHTHETEEVFVLLKGEVIAMIGEKEVRCKAPATLICPANVPHQLINIGEEPTDQILVIGIDSKIFDSSGKEMFLPWR